MSDDRVSAVFDCMIFLQGLGHRLGPSRRCLELVDQGRVILYMSQPIRSEVTDVLSRPTILRKFPEIEGTVAQSMLSALWTKVHIYAHPAKSFMLPRDPDDEPYTDLAIATAADFLVTWNDRHLTYLMRKDTPEGIDFCARFPHLKIVDPPTFLRQSDWPST